MHQMWLLLMAFVGIVIGVTEYADINTIDSYGGWHFLMLAFVVCVGICVIMRWRHVRHGINTLLYHCKYVAREFWEFVGSTVEFKK
jgi:hypothetical protein